MGPRAVAAYRRAQGLGHDVSDRTVEDLWRYAFLSGYPTRSDAEQEEMVRLREALRVAGIDHGWSEVEREVPNA